MLANAAPTPLSYVECDVPAGMTLDDWRRAPSRAHGATVTPMGSVLRRVRRTQRARRRRREDGPVLTPAL